MTSELSSFAARFRALMFSPGPAGGDKAGPIRDFLPECRSFDFGGLALELFALQFHANRPYRKICEARKTTPLTISDWKNIPAVPTAAFKELDLTCLRPEQRTHVFHSSGTTAQRPSRHFHGPESLALYEASLWAAFHHALRSADHKWRLLILTPPPEQSPHSSLVHMFEVVRTELGAGAIEFVGRVGEDGAWTMDFAAILTRLEPAAASKSPLLLLGTGFSYVHLLDHLTEANLRVQLPSGSRVLETGGYKGRAREIPKAELHARITQRLGVPASAIICEYGMSELSSQAYDGVAGVPGEVSGVSSHAPDHSSRIFHFPPWARVQIISPETGREVADGETGLIRVFDLANVFSVMAIQTEDLAVRRGGGFEFLGRGVTAEPRGCSLTAA